MVKINYNKFNWQLTGTRIKKERKALGLTQSQLMEQIGRAPDSYRVLGRWEKGDAIPLLSDLVELCNIFNCDLGYLIGEHATKRHINANICEVTGLSEKAIEVLKSCQGTSEWIKIVSLLIEQEMPEPELSYGNIEMYAEMSEEQEKKAAIKTEETDRKYAEEYAKWAKENYVPVINSIYEYLIVDVNMSQEYYISSDGTVKEAKFMSKGELWLGTLSKVSPLDLIEQVLLNKIETELKALKQKIK